METKKDRVTKVTKFDKLDNYGNTSFKIEFELGDAGFYSTKTPDKIPFVVGNVADYKIEKKDKNGGGHWFKVTLPQDENKFSGGGFQKKSVDPKVQLAGYAASYTKDLVVAGKIDLSKYKETFEMIFTLMSTKI